MNIFANAIPSAPPADMIAWATGLKVNGHSFDPEQTPQLIVPIRCMFDAETRIGTLVKPVQVGGSTAGEVVCAGWCAFGHGLIQYNWDDDERAKQKWPDRIKPVLASCRDIKRTGVRFEELICEAHYPNTTLRVQGVFAEGALDSDTVPYQINEEMHLWKPGMMGKARRRQTRVWNSKALDISNAGQRPKEGEKSDGKSFELWYAFTAGTMEEWETLCPGCGQYHVMRTRWEDDKPELGGLRYDSDGCDMGNGQFNYNKLAGTLRYQMPCGFLIHNHPMERRALQHGRYSAPRNEGALISHRSWRFDAVSCMAVEWMTLVQEKHAALRALKAGDDKPWMRYVTERECQFYGPDSVPYSGQTIYIQNLRKNREGLAGRAYRAATFDWQQGIKAKGELQHYWGVIEDVMPNGDSQIVWEGKVESDTELLAEVDGHNVPRSCVWIDASKNTKAILQLCYQSGMNAVMLNESHRGTFPHKDGVRRFYSEERAIARELNTPLKFAPVPSGNGFLPHPQEPVVVSLNKAGMLSNHFFIRNMQANVLAANPKAGPGEYIRVEIPGDVSEDFRRQNESWERVPGLKRSERDGGVEGFKQRSRIDHLLMCRAYQDFLKEWTGLLGERLAALGISRAIEPEGSTTENAENTEKGKQ